MNRVRLVDFRRLHRRSHSGGFEGSEDGAEGVEARGRDFGTAGLALGFVENGVEFHRATHLEVDHCRGSVGSHGDGADELGVGVGGVDGMTQCRGHGDGLAHEVAGDGAPGGRLQNILGRERSAKGLSGLSSPVRDAVEACRTGDAETIEGNVPDELAPTGLQQIRADFAGNAR